MLILTAMQRFNVCSRLAPGLKGLGYGMSMIPTVVNFYYVVIMAYALLFLFNGFTSKLPWTDCANDWNSQYCFSQPDQAECIEQQTDTVFFNKSCITVKDFCSKFNKNITAGNYTHCFENDNEIIPIPLEDVTTRMYPSQEFWNTNVLVCVALHSINILLPQYMRIDIYITENDHRGKYHCQ